MKHPFDKYIFCERESSALNALQKRVEEHFPKADVSYVLGDCNEMVDKICEKIPTGSQGHKVLSFCFVDPFDLSVKFSTIAKISEKFVDFLILLALGMDANRNLQSYLDPLSRKIDEFLGLPDWREHWVAHGRRGKASFPQFLAETYATRMESLGYLPVPFHQMKAIRSDIRNLPLYHLALFSRHQRAYEYWNQVLKYSTAQMSLGI